MVPPLKKQTRKANGFGLWLTREGRGNFTKKYRTRYEGDLAEHKDMMGGMWNELTEEQKEMWRQRAKEENETGEYKRYAIVRDQERRRNMATSSIEENLAKMNQHNQRVAQEKQRKEVKINYVRKLKPTSKSMNLEEFELIRQKQRDGDISNRLNFAMKKRKTPSEPGRYGGQMYLLTMFVYLDCYINESIQVYPAEMTLIKFTVEEGVVSTRTWHINFEPRKYFIESDGEIPEWAQENLSQNVDKMNRSLDWIEYIDGGCTIGQAWIELKEEICGKPFVLFDANQNNFIRPGLHFLALESYDGAMRYNEEYDFDRDVAPNLYAIQDFARMVNKFDGTNQGPDINKYIEERFRRPGQPVEDASYCRLHQSTNTAQDMTGRLHCTLAHGIRLLDAFFDSMRLLGVNPDFPDYFTNQKQYFDVEQMAPGYYDMCSIIPTVDDMPIKSKKTADEMYKSVEHSMRALATNETARLPPRMMAALTHGTSAQQERQEDYDRPGPSHRYSFVLPPASSREREVPANTPNASFQIDPNFLPTSLQRLFRCQPNSRPDPNSSACKHVPLSYVYKVNIKNRMQMMADAEWDSLE